MGLDEFAFLLKIDAIPPDAKENVRGIKLEMIEARESGDKYTFFGLYVE